MKTLRCVSCGDGLEGGSVESYPHSGGVEVNGVKYWIYVICPACGYQNSFKKLGLSPEEAAKLLKVRL
ncbi:MAG: hypothetical protein QW318_03485 [Candidatus Caldarchaeum sp.]|jgi:phage FluMu protein Com|uniref:Uncharacterized protein n=1 Tax=Caldiarchaeum subterraneum TaxID=311458 RepID=A0A7J3G4I1_CALS0